MNTAAEFWLCQKVVYEWGSLNIRETKLFPTFAIAKAYAESAARKDGRPMEWEGLALHDSETGYELRAVQLEGVPA